MKIKHLLITASLTAFVAGCATNPDDPNAKAKQKAAIGAAIGTAAGLLTGDSATERRQHAMVGAAIGAGVGAGVGHYQDKQEAALRKQLQGKLVLCSWHTLMQIGCCLTSNSRSMK